METENNADRKRNIISNWFLNEHTLLIVSKADEEEYPTVSIRYEKYGEVRHKDLAVLTPDVRVEHNEKMIALFKKQGKVVKKFKLVSVYDTICQEFIDGFILYRECNICGRERH